MEANEGQTKGAPVPKVAKAAEKRVATASRPRMTAEELKARGLDPAPYGAGAKKA